MSWIFFALLPAALWAADNYIDKHVLDKYLNKYHPGILVLFLAISGLIIALLIPFSGADVSFVENKDILALLFSGVIFTFSTIPSTLALNKVSATYVAALFRTGPIFSYFLALAFLDEVLSMVQIFGALVVLVGAVSLSIELNNETKKKKLNYLPLLLMLLSSFMMAVNALIFKAVSRNELPFWQNIFWQHIGIFLGGVLIFLVVKKYRKDFISCIKTSGTKVLTWSTISGIVGLGGRVSFYYATLFAPLAIVSTLTSFQPVFSLIYGLLLARFIASYRIKRQTVKQLFQEVISIMIILVGTVALLNF